MSGHDGAATEPDDDADSGEDAGATAECYRWAGLVSGARGTQRDTNPTNCSTRVEFDNYKASYLRM
ncbi:hypothetical protein A5779_27495 [Mycolicibacterium peregrinum]|uniref:Uncharacterized protein n=1 Tax=Mycolicibacterium peregrinum TaxID=43304 RepID=A0A1A0W2M0_MYCPR|nr:hypothetical protein A5779_27495 [Mycolicibacterium peregrinum]